MAKIETLQDVPGIAAIAENNDKIEAALANTLSLDGTLPNSMEGDFDMNGNQILNVGQIDMNGGRILNLADAVSNQEPVTLAQASVIAGVTNPLTQDSVAAVLWPRTAAEVAASVTPVNYEYEPGNVLRYGTNTVPGTTNMKAAIQAALDTGHVVKFEPGTYYIATGLTWDTDEGIIEANGAIITTDQDIVGLTIGTNGTSQYNWRSQIRGYLYLRNTATSTKQGFLFRQCYEGRFEVSAEGWNKGVELTATAAGCVYNEFYIGRMWNNDYGIYLHPTSDGWVNENNFYGGRFATGSGVTSNWLIYIPEDVGTYPRPDNNKFFGPSLENAATATTDGCYYDGGVQNRLLYARVEAANTSSIGDIYIAETAIAAHIAFPYQSYTSPTYQNIIDNGEATTIQALDQWTFIGRGTASTPVLKLGRESANTDRGPAVQFSDYYNGSQSSQVVLLEAARAYPQSTGDDDYYLRCDNLGSIVNGSDGREYVCILSHTSAATDEPGVGVNWETYWKLLQTRSAASTTDWATSTSYTGTAITYRLRGDGMVTKQTHRTGTAAPTTAANYVGELYINTTADDAYIAIATGSGTPADDWKKITP